MDGSFLAMLVIVIFVFVGFVVLLNMIQNVQGTQAPATNTTIVERDLYPRFGTGWGNNWNGWNNNWGNNGWNWNRWSRPVIRPIRLHRA